MLDSKAGLPYSLVPAAIPAMNQAVDIITEKTRKVLDSSSLEKSEKEAVMHDSSWADVSTPSILREASSLTVRQGPPRHCRSLRRLLAHCALLRSKDRPSLLRLDGRRAIPLPVTDTTPDSSRTYFRGPLLHIVRFCQRFEANQAS